MKTKLISFVLTFSTLVLLCAGVFSISAFAQTYTVGDIVSFGSYPQSRVTDAALAAKLENQNADEQGRVLFNNVYYRKYTLGKADRFQSANGYKSNTSYWFKVEEILWDVLSVDSGKMTVMSHYIIDTQRYNSEYVDITWEKSTLRSFLNDDFYSKAFDSGEKNNIVPVNNVNENNERFKTSGGNDTADKVYLLSWSDALNSSYGFSGDYSKHDNARKAMGTDYAKAQGLMVIAAQSGEADGCSHWWLRSPGYSQNLVCYVHSVGLCDYMFYVNNSFVGVRPVINLKLSASVKTVDDVTQTQTQTKKANGADEDDGTASGRTSVGEGITVTGEKSVLIIGDSVKLSAKINADGADASSQIKWESSDAKTASVDSDGKVTAKSSGDVTIKASAEDGKYHAEYAIKVKEPTVVALDRFALVIEYHDEDTLMASAENGEQIFWKSSDAEVVSVDADGNVKATGAGDAVITAYTKSGASAQCNITVKYAWWQWLIIIFLFGWIWYI